MDDDDARPLDQQMRAISAAIRDLYHAHFGVDSIAVKSYMNGDVVLCLIDGISPQSETALVKAWYQEQVMDTRVAFQEISEAGFSNAVSDITGRSVVAYMSANQATPDLAAELFFLAPVGQALAV